MSEKNVIVYYTKKCSKCKNLKAWLRRNKIAFTTKSLDETDVMTDLVMRNIVALSAPVLETEDRVFLSNQIFLDNSSMNPSFKQFLRGKKS